MRAKRMLALVAGLTILGTAGRIGAQSLADVAKKEEERRKQTPAGKVYTNKDLGAVPPSSVPPPATDGDKPKDASSAAGAKDDKDAGKDDKGKGETRTQAYWVERRKTLQETIDRDSTFLAALQSRVNALTTDFVNRDDPAQRAAIERDRQKALTELSRLQKQVQDDRKAMSDLEEEARRAGVPPGWLR